MKKLIYTLPSSLNCHPNAIEWRQLRSWVKELDGEYVWKEERMFCNEHKLY